MEKEMPDVLYRKPGTTEFKDKFGTVFYTGEQCPQGYKQNGWIKPLSLPSPLEVWEKQDE